MHALKGRNITSDGCKAFAALIIVARWGGSTTPCDIAPFQGLRVVIPLPYSEFHLINTRLKHPFLFRKKAVLLT